MRSELSFPHLVVDRSEDRGVHVLVLTGELGLSSLGELETALDATAIREQPLVCLDLTELQFIDSSGLAAVSRAHAKLADADGALVVVCVAGPVQRTVMMTGLLEVLTVRDSRAAALDALAPAA